MEVRRLGGQSLDQLRVFASQASQLGLYRAFVDNYEAAVETAERCCQANSHFAEIAEVRPPEGPQRASAAPPASAAAAPLLYADEFRLGAAGWTGWLPPVSGGR